MKTTKKMMMKMMTMMRRGPLRRTRKRRRHHHQGQEGEGEGEGQHQGRLQLFGQAQGLWLLVRPLQQRLPGQRLQGSAPLHLHDQWPPTPLSGVAPILRLFLHAP